MLKSHCVVVATMIVLAQNGCQHGILGKRNAELCCPTDIRKTLKWSCGEDAIFCHPCATDCEYHGHKPTCWREWPSSAESWRDGTCGPMAIVGSLAPTSEWNSGGEIWSSIQDPANAIVPLPNPKMDDDGEEMGQNQVEDRRDPPAAKQPDRKANSSDEEPAIEQPEVKQTNDEVQWQPLNNRNDMSSIRFTDRSRTHVVDVDVQQTAFEFEPFPAPKLFSSTFEVIPSSKLR